MKVIVNRQELLEPLAKHMLFRWYKSAGVDYSATRNFVNGTLKRKRKIGSVDATIDQLREAMTQDTKLYLSWLVTDYKNKYRPLVNWLNNNFCNLGIDDDVLMCLYMDPGNSGFTKSIATNMFKEFECILATDDDFHDDVLIRNIIDNEASLSYRLSNRGNFWFTDAGYTNFLEHKGKPWHRLVRNHIHTDLRHLNFPADRLNLLPSMPCPWRNTGNKILVVESSDSYYNMFGTDRITWRNNIAKELSKYSDRPVEYRTKPMNRKVRKSVYDLLMSTDEYYCVISDSSAAAIEAVWAGVPIITLNTHVTVPVARTKISDIDNLYRESVGDWLCALSYSQFTKQEMIDGTAHYILEKYHA